MNNPEESKRNLESDYISERQYWENRRFWERAAILSGNARPEDFMDLEEQLSAG